MFGLRMIFTSSRTNRFALFWIAQTSQFISKTQRFETSWGKDNKIDCFHDTYCSFVTKTRTNGPKFDLEQILLHALVLRNAEQYILKRNKIVLSWNKWCLFTPYNYPIFPWNNSVWISSVNDLRYRWVPFNPKMDNPNSRTKILEEVFFCLFLWVNQPTLFKIGSIQIPRLSKPMN